MEATSDREFLARLMRAEARGEGPVGWMAVGLVVMRRVEDIRWPNTVRGVVMQKLRGASKFQFSCNNPGDASRPFMLEPAPSKYLAVADLVIARVVVDVTFGATHYHADWMTPWWARSKQMEKTATIGRHVFWKESPA
jgi:spore germination cell wall hydrolase CwlJ-like protein